MLRSCVGFKDKLTVFPSPSSSAPSNLDRFGEVPLRISSAFLFASCLKTVWVSGSEPIAARRFALRAAVSMMGRGIVSRMQSSGAKRLSEGLSWGVPSRGFNNGLCYLASEIRRPERMLLSTSACFGELKAFRKPTTVKTCVLLLRDRALNTIGHCQDRAGFALGTHHVSETLR